MIFDICVYYNIDLYKYIMTPNALIMRKHLTKAIIITESLPTAYSGML